MPMLSSPMFARLPDGKPSLRAAYDSWLRAREEPHRRAAPEGTLKVGICGAGMAGLYAALLLRREGHEVTLFEREADRVGGRIYTHRFNDEPNQYFEAGAMRLPEIPEQQPVFDLVDYVNERVPPQMAVELITYVLSSDENLVLVNGRRKPDGSPYTMKDVNDDPSLLGFPLPPDAEGKTASDLINEAIGWWLALLEKDFDAGFLALMTLDSLSFFTYLRDECGWSIDEINYVEVMTSQTNQFMNSFVELVIENMDFSGSAWKTIKDGMDRLPNACAEIIGRDRFRMGHEVEALEELADGRVLVRCVGREPEAFDRVIAAVPPAVLRMWRTPQWPVAAMHAVRAMHFEPLYKIGLRFKSRFWEQVSPPSRGGQSITDLPSRWCVYPSYGIGDAGPGVLLLYCWMTDAAVFLPQTQEDRVRIALRDLQTLYAGMVDIGAEFIESFDVAWSALWPTGDAMFFPGQFGQLFAAARQPQGNVFFAGEHLSVHHTWIVGALDSALLAVQQMLGDPELQPLAPDAVGKAARTHHYDYARCADAPATGETPALAPATWHFG